MPTDLPPRPWNEFGGAIERRKFRRKEFVASLGFATLPLAALLVTLVLGCAVWETQQCLPCDLVYVAP